MILHKSYCFNVIWTNLKCDLYLEKKIFRKQSFFKKLRRKITFQCKKHKIFDVNSEKKTTLWTITCSKPTLKILEQSVKYVES